MPTRDSRQFLRATARAFAGALIFVFPMLMTMEMWWLGFYMGRPQLLVFMLVSLPVLVGLSYYSGFEETFDWWEDVEDALVAFAIGATTTAVMLTLFGVLTWNMPWDMIVGTILVQTVPAAIGALLARKQMGSGTPDNEQKKKAVTYFGTMFLMAVGALFVAFNVAPTEEMILIAYKMTPWHGLVLMVASIIVLHAFVYTIGFYGEERHDGSFWNTFYHFTVAGYAVALLVSLFTLWVFGRTDGQSIAEIVMPMVVLGFPAALGAATARLIL